MKAFNSKYIALGGGIDGTSPESNIKPGRLRMGRNVEAKPGGGYRSIKGYSKFDSDVVPGEGDILGVWYYNGVTYAFRNAAGGATAVMFASTGSGWTSKKTGLAPDGSYEFTNYAFSGTQKMYGVSGTHQAFQWDGTTWTDLATLMATDTPDHIYAHKKHLFLSFGNSSQNSSLGDPTSWSVITGAGEILLDQDITGYSSMPNGSLGIFTSSSIMLLAGSSTADWVANNMVEYGNNAGALPGTIQGMGSSVRFCDSRGIIDLAASDVSSDFYDAIISHDMDDIIGNGWSGAISATVVREKGQYRLFFGNGTGLILVFNDQRVMITQTLWPDPVLCVVNTEDSSGTELIFFGSDTGYIYQMEDGRTFGGATIDAYLETAFTDLGYRHNVKRFKRCRFDVGKYGKTGLTVLPRYVIDNGQLSSESNQEPGYEGDGVPLGVLAILGEAIMGGLPINEGTMNLNGIAQWISFRFSSASSTEDPWEVDGVSVDFAAGRKRR